MSDHFFYVSRKKNAGLYKFLVLLNICCTVGIISLTYVMSYKDLMMEKMHVIEEFLDVDSLAKSKYLNDFAAFHSFLESVAEVR